MALGTGLLIRRQRRGIGTAGVALGLAGLAASSVRMTAADVSSGPLLALAAVWGYLFWLYVVWLAVILARGSPLLARPGGVIEGHRYRVASGVRSRKSGTGNRGGPRPRNVAKLTRLVATL